MTLLDLGCGWGSLSLWLAERYPASRIVAVSNSRVQREFLLPRAPANLEIVTADVSEWEPEERFDRILSVEMLEHVRNYELVFGRIASWLDPAGLFFVHVFSNRLYTYPYDEGRMARTYFTAGNMPSDDLLLHFQRDLSLRDHWRVSGEQYAQTAEAWLKRLDGNREQALTVLADAYGGGRLAGELARLFPRVRRAVGVQERPQVAGLALPLLLVMREGKRPQPEPLSRRWTSVSFADGRRRACPSSCNAKTPCSSRGFL